MVRRGGVPLVRRRAVQYNMELDDYDVTRLLFELSARRGMIRDNDAWIAAFLARLKKVVEDAATR